MKRRSPRRRWRRQLFDGLNEAMDLMVAWHDLLAAREAQKQWAGMYRLGHGGKMWHAHVLSDLSSKYEIIPGEASTLWPRLLRAVDLASTRGRTPGWTTSWQDVQLLSRLCRDPASMRAAEDGLRAMLANIKADMAMEVLEADE